MTKAWRGEKNRTGGGELEEKDAENEEGSAPPDADESATAAALIEDEGEVEANKGSGQEEAEEAELFFSTFASRSAATAEGKEKKEK